MKMPCAPFIVSALLLLACSATTASGALTYTTIDHPLAGAGGTVPNDIEGNRIVGTYFDNSGLTHGFLYDGATWATLDFPAAAAPRATEAYGVSNGVVCGTYTDSTGQSLGFLYDGVNWTSLEHPPLGVGRADTFVRGISGGTVVGYSIDTLVARGFVYSNGVFNDFLVPGAVGTFPQDVDAGVVAGTYDDLIGTHGFLYTGGIATTLDHPLGLPFGTFVTGIDGRNVVGNYLSMLDGMSHGFLYDGTGFTTIDVPGATDTAVNGVSGTRVVGSYVDMADATHGFVATVPDPVAVAPALCVIPLLSRHSRRTTQTRAARPRHASRSTV